MNAQHRIDRSSAPIVDQTGRVRCGCVQSLIGIYLSIAVLAGNLTWAQNAQNDSAGKGNVGVATEKTFGEDVLFLRQHVDTIVLQSKSGQAQVAVVPAYQGRVMTSSATGATGLSFGWINYAHVEAGEIAPQINVYGGEERFWLGPEGGQFSIFFKPGAKFEFAEWATPAVIDTEPFVVVDQSDRMVSFQKETSLRNYSNTDFEIRIERQVELLSDAQAALSLGTGVDQLEFVGYRTTNRITNIGKAAWTRETGLLSIWLLGMYKPGPRTTVVIPYRADSGDASATNESAPVVNDDYFGQVPDSRLKISDDVIYFSGDGTYRSKIGISPQRSTGLCGSYDAQRSVLTIVKYNKPGREVSDYVNSMWELQENPYKGDAVNAYNDGPPAPGADPLGPFYELETSSPAFALKPSESGVHVQETYHFEGERQSLDRLSKEFLGVSLEQIEAAFQ